MVGLEEGGARGRARRAPRRRSRRRSIDAASGRGRRRPARGARARAWPCAGPARAARCAIDSGSGSKNHVETNVRHAGVHGTFLPIGRPRNPARPDLAVAREREARRRRTPGCWHDSGSGSKQACSDDAWVCASWRSSFSTSHGDASAGIAERMSCSPKGAPAGTVQRNVATAASCRGTQGPPDTKGRHAPAETEKGTRAPADAKNDESRTISLRDGDCGDAEIAIAKLSISRLAARRVRRGARLFVRLRGCVASLCVRRALRPGRGRFAGPLFFAGRPGPGRARPARDEAGGRAQRCGAPPQRGLAEISVVAARLLRSAAAVVPAPRLLCRRRALARARRRNPDELNAYRLTYSSLYGRLYSSRRDSRAAARINSPSCCPCRSCARPSPCPSTSPGTTSHFPKRRQLSDDATGGAELDERARALHLPRGQPQVPDGVLALGHGAQRQGGESPRPSRRRPSRTRSPGPQAGASKQKPSCSNRQVREQLQQGRSRAPSTSSRSMRGCARSIT